MPGVGQIYSDVPDPRRVKFEPTLTVTRSRKSSILR